MGNEDAVKPAEAAPQGLTKELASKVMQADLANIVKKVKSGKPLTGPERRIVEDAAAKAQPASPRTKRWARNQVELAAALGCERKTIQRYRRLKDAPKARSNGKWSIDEWRAFLEQAGALESNDPNKSALQAEQILLQNQRLRNKLAIEREEWIPKAVVRQVFTQHVTEVKSMLFGSIIRLVTLARAAADTTQAAGEVRKELEAVCQSLVDSEYNEKK
jgi:hypothetical protein